MWKLVISSEWQNAKHVYGTDTPAEEDDVMNKNLTSYPRRSAFSTEKGTQQPQVIIHK